MRKPRIVFFLSHILGLRTDSGYIREAVAGMEDVLEARFITFTTKSYRECRPFGRWNLWKNRFETPYCARELFRREAPPSFDAIFLGSFEFAHALRDWVDRVPCMLYTDTTDELAHEQVYLREPGPANHLKWKVKDLVTKSIYARPLRSMAALLPTSQWCADSLHRHYGIARERIFVQRAGLDTQLWKPDPEQGVEEHRGPLRLLFVGNDFLRKGGRLLLEMQQRHLGGKCELTIVSNDPALPEMELPDGVRLVRGMNHERIDELVRLYQQSDVFVFPTLLDKMPQALHEAVCCGLAAVVSDCGANRALVFEGENGFVLDYGSPAEQWAERILRLERDRDLLASMKRTSRAFAEQNLTKERFAANLRRVLGTVFPEIVADGAGRDGTGA